MNNIHHYYLLFIVYHPRGKNKLVELNNENKIDTSIIHIDSTNTINMNGITDVSYGHKRKGKKDTKIHVALSNNYIPLSIHITKANINDTTQLETNLKNIPFKIISSNKKPTYITVDKGYLSKKNFNIIDNELKLKMLCHVRKNANMKHSHNKTLFNRLKRKYNQEKYKERLKIERFFSHLKRSQKIQLRTDRKTDTYLGSILLIILNIIFIRTDKI